MTRREQALRKIRRLERQLDTASNRAGANIEREINRLQLTYDITMEEIKGKTGLPWYFPESVRKILRG